MNLPSETIGEVGYLVAAFCFILALKGLSSPRTARRGNLLGAAGAGIALLTVLFAEGDDVEHVPWIVLAIAVGAAIAVPTARLGPMTRMPQLIALFPGAGGAAAAAVALLERPNATPDLGSQAAVVVAVLLGSVSCSGSLVALLKLRRTMTSRPVILPGAGALLIVALVVAGGLGAAVPRTAGLAAGLLLTVAALILGVMVVLPVDGADLPVISSLLNAFTGLAVAAVGLVLQNPLLLVAGTLVGAAGTILTRLMAAALGRSVTGVLIGPLRAGSPAGPPGAGPDRPVTSVGPGDVARRLRRAAKVIVVPGYGLAVAQAQHSLRGLAEALEATGIEVLYGIHPAAGRMPGHMNVLLAEADVPYRDLKGTDEINREFRSADVVLVVGANDVVNPAATTDPGAPLYGMPVLDVAEAQHMIFLKRSLGPGSAGIENELLHHPKTSLLFGDAKDSLAKVRGAVESL